MDYYERHGLNLKSFGNWRAQLKREGCSRGTSALGAVSAAATSRRTCRAMLGMARRSGSTTS